MRYPTYKVTLTHDGRDPESFEVYIDLMLDEADNLMKWTGQTWGEWLGGVDAREPGALRFLYWLARKRAGNPVDGKFSDINFFLHQIDNEMIDGGDFVSQEPEPVVVDGVDPTPGDVTESS